MNLSSRATTDDEIEAVMKMVHQALKTGSDALQTAYQDQQVVVVTNVAQALGVMMKSLDDGKGCQLIQSLPEDQLSAVVDLIAVGVVAGIGLSIQEEIR